MRIHSMLEVLRARLPAMRVLSDDETTRLMGAGVLVGVVGAFAAAALDRLILLGSSLLLRTDQASLGGFPWWMALLAPAAGGLVAGLLVNWGTREGRPKGISDVIDAEWNHAGRLSVRDAVATAAAAAAAVGGGMSGGREGPTVQLAAALSSRLARALSLPARRARVLIAAGAAAGIAASFNTPIGAAFFALEVVLGDFAMRMFGPVVAATVTGTVLGQAMLGERVVLPLAHFDLANPLELPLYGLLGAICGGVAVGFKRTLAIGQLQAARSHLPPAIRPALAGLLVGVIAALGGHAVMGNGYGFMKALLLGELNPGFTVLAVLLVAKLVASVLTNVSGAGTGVLSPTLVIGALTGTAFGQLVHGAWPTWTESAGAYGLVGMGAVAAAVTHAPITIALMLFEMTGNYQIILPLLLALAVAGIVAAAFDSESVYIATLRRRGVSVEPQRERLLMYDLRVQDVMRSRPEEVIRHDAPFSELAHRFLEHRVNELFAVDEVGRLHGLVELQDVKALIHEPHEELRVADVEARRLPTLRPEQPIAEALPLFFRADLDELPVVDGEGVLLGVLRERDVIGAYDSEVLKQDALLARVEAGPETSREKHFFELPEGSTLRAVPLPDAMASHSLFELALPRRYGFSVIAVVRTSAKDGREERLPAERDLELRQGDRLIVFGECEAVELFEARGGVPVEEEATEEF
ncbi:MAG: chloride channel protein [Alphaproteobacteria bacterium]|nr:chloride channel protein [Alphaproteobacteria bacterium]